MSFSAEKTVPMERSPVRILSVASVLSVPYSLMIGPGQTHLKPAETATLGHPAPELWFQPPLILNAFAL
jgi:hypothetical protein